ncbi:uncharacterized protein LOC129311355 isoform X4 [Prosopis cineraria]|uniref:uncharacterized protein LOC129311355 isoform X4 n=1 Tax=Prosopis cineraria TaxID=364024 RepID=UPI002410952B|nr:uncharacterized protein LOC129311355 isoform X4 [Prosopis cineraria]
MDGNSTGKSKKIVEKANKHPDWLPEGWSVDVRRRKSGPSMGAGYKCYIDPLNGYKFYSKPEVLRYLNALNGNGNSLKKGCTVTHSPSNVAVEKSTVDNSLHGSTKEIEIGKNGTVIKNDLVVLENSTVDDLQPGSTQEAEMITKDMVETGKSAADDLPPGWIKEVKIGKNGSGIRKDPYYTDPVNGYVFRSKKDAWRYVESGDITKCLYKPTKRQIEDEDSSTPSSKAKRQKLKQPATKRQLFLGRKISKKKSTELSDTNSSVKGHNVKTVEAVVKMHSLEDAAANAPEMNRTSDPGALKNADEKKHRSPGISNKKGLSVPHRFSRRLAGAEPDQVSESDIIVHEQSLFVPKRSLRKGRTARDIDSANVLSQQLNAVLKIEHTRDIPGELQNKSNRISEDQRDFREQSNHNSLSNDYSSPNLNGTTKPTGDLPIMDNLLIENKLNAGEIRKSGNKSSNEKVHHIPYRASKRLAGYEPDITGSMLCDKPPEYKAKKSKVGANAESHQIGSIPSKEPAYHASTSINVPRVGESSGRSKSSRKVRPRTCEQEKLGEKQLDDEKSEPQLSFAFHYSWSDPSVEFAIQTLTGALPVEDSVHKEPVFVPETDDVDKTKLSKNVTEGQGPVLVPETDYVDKTKLPKNTTECQRPVLVPEADADDKTKLSKIFIKGCNDKNRQVTPKKSKSKKEPTLPRRLSKRLAGHEPETAPSDRALEYASSKKSCKDELTATATSGNGALKHIDFGEETQLDLQASTCPESRAHGESSNKNENSNEVQIDPREQLQKVEAEKVQEGSETELSLPFGDSWSDTCFEFAVKTLTGALPVDGAEEILPVITPDLNCPPNTGLLESVVENCINEEALDNMKQSQNNEDINKVCQLSKQLPDQPESFISSTSCQHAPKFASIESYGDDAKITWTLNQSQKRADINEIFQPSKEFLGQPELLINSISCEMVCQPSKDLLGHAELRTSSTSCENTTNFFAKECHGDEANITTNLDERASLNIGAGNEFQIAHQSRNVDASKLEESSYNISKVLGQESGPAKQPQLETRIERQHKSDLQFSSPLVDSWSDPCLEFAYKTLTGAIPVEENLSIQGCFQEPANNCCGQKDASPMLPDFGPPSLSRGDISFHYNVKSMPGQQSSMSSSTILPPEKVGPHWFPEFDSQKHYSQSSKNSQGG